MFKKHLFQNHKTCKHICINNLTRTLTKKLLARTKDHTIMLNCGATDCTNRSITHPEKSFHRLPSIPKKE